MNAASIAREIADRVEANLPKVNCGGCGLFAYELHKRLEKRGVESSIVLMWSGSPPTGTDINSVHFIEQELYRVHFAVRIGDTLVDARGEIDCDEVMLSVGANHVSLFDPDELEVLLRPPHASVWNYVFWNSPDRKRLPKLVEAAVDAACA